MKKSKQKNRRLKRYVRKQSKKALLEEKELYFEEKLAKILRRKKLPRNYLDYFPEVNKPARMFIHNAEVHSYDIGPHHHNPEQLHYCRHRGDIKVFDKED